MRDIFISYVEEESAIAMEIAAGLETAGYSSWYYERDGMPGASYLLQTNQAIKECQVVVLIISHNSVESHQVTKEVVRAHESNKPFIPIRLNISDFEFKQRQPEWEEALGASTSISIPPEGVSVILPKVIGGLKKMGIEPNPNAITGPLKSSAMKMLDRATGKLQPATAAEPARVKTRPEPATSSEPAAISKTASRKKLLVGISAITIAAVITAILVSGLMSREPAKPKLRTTEFSQMFTDLNTLGGWAIPASGWSVEKDERLHVDSQPSLGYPKDISFDDFEMKFNLRLTNEIGAAWALRAKDPHSYCLRC